WRQPSTTLFPYTTLFRSYREFVTWCLEGNTCPCYLWLPFTSCPRRGFLYVTNDFLNIHQIHRSGFLSSLHPTGQRRGPERRVERSEEHTSELQSRENLVC